MKYPFEPKSTSSLKQGQYWCFQLCDGRYCAVIVLSRVTDNGKLDRRLFTAALVDWVGSQPATPSDLAKPKLLKRGFTHVRSVQMYGRVILGEVSRRLTEFPPEFPFSYAATPGWPVLGLASLRYDAEIRWGDEDWVRREVAIERATLDRNPRVKKVNIDV